jgi:prephenate dehydratase
MKIAYQGEPGAYSEAAALEHFGEQVETVPCESFEKVFQSVSDELCDHGLIPIENSLAGSIHQNYDLLLENNLWVVGEHHLRVSHCLVALPGVQASEIQRVISHPQALAQCRNNLRKILPSAATEAVYDTAGSVKMVRQQKDRTVAAIASRRAAEIYQMQILADNIEDNPSNFTRFLLIATSPVQPEQDAKTSIVFSAKNQAGALFRSLAAFALRDIDLTKIESRPLVGKPWEYWFYIDFIGSTQNENVSRALAHLEESATFLRILGSYPRYRH